MSAEQDLANANVQIANLISEVTRFRDAAMGINNLWPTITEGRNNTADGKYFSVPGSGAYLRLYRRAGSSQTLIAEFPDRAQVQGIVDAFGGRGVIGSGDLMAQGFAGLGVSLASAENTVSASQLDALNITCYVRLSEAIAGTLDATALVHHIEGGASATQYATRRGSFDQRWRVRLGPNPTDWTGWQMPYRQGNIVGTVSNSAGIPTGSLIEKGSNADGSYWKFAGNVMFCVREVVLDLTVAGQEIDFQWARSFTGSIYELAGSFTAGSTGVTQQPALKDLIFSSRLAAGRIALPTAAPSGETAYRGAIMAFGPYE